MLVWLYNLFFVLALPLLLAAWASRVDAILDLPQAPPGIGAALTVLGAALMLWAIIVFMGETGVAPSNAASPKRRVIGGPYQVFSDPIYVGAALLAFGASALAHSGGGFWLVAPALSLGATALVFGREALIRPALPSESHRSLLSIPEGSQAPPTLRQRAGALLHIVAFVAVAELSRFSNTANLGPALVLASVGGILIALAGTRSTWTLRRLLIGWWTAGAVLLASCAGPAPLLAAAWPVWTYGVMALAALVGALMPASRRSLIVVAILAALVSMAPDGLRLPLGLAILAASALSLHNVLLRICQAIANSWAALQIGPFRIINYASYAFAGAAIGAGAFVVVVGDKGLAASIIIAACIVVSAGLWGQLVEFSGKLARPFGYYGALLGAFLGVGVAAAILQISPWLLGAGLVLGAPAAQALGRLRCLVQGCCHGRLVYHPSKGIVYKRPQSRVLRIAKLGNQPVHPTPLYSIYANAFVQILLVRLLLAGAPQTQLIGVYLVVSGSLRFIEEAYRGEPQTPVWRGLKLYQWLALAQAITGVAFTLLRSAPVPALSGLSIAGIGAALLVGSIAGFAMGIDFPGAKRRFSQLTPTDP